MNIATRFTRAVRYYLRTPKYEVIVDHEQVGTLILGQYTTRDQAEQIAADWEQRGWPTRIHNLNSR